MYMLVYYQFNTCSALYHHLLSLARMSVCSSVRLTHVHTHTQKKWYLGCGWKVVLAVCHAIKFQGVWLKAKCTERLCWMTAHGYLWLFSYQDRVHSHLFYCMVATFLHNELLPSLVNRKGFLFLKLKKKSTEIKC